jgi:hypothetical protein
MGVVANIDYDKFPEQRWKGVRCKVYFNFDTSKSIGGVIVRDDREPPHMTIIQLDDGRFVLASECQYQITESRLVLNSTEKGDIA